jgi:hypothetical protein
MGIVHDSDMSGLHGPADSIDNTAVANPQASDLVYHKWNSLCTRHLLRFMQKLTSEAVDQLSKSEEMLQREFKAFLVRGLKLGLNADFLSLVQIQNPRNFAGTRKIAASVSVPRAYNHIEEQIEILNLLVVTIRQQLEKLEGASGALGKDHPIKLLTITEPKAAKLTEMEKLIRSRLLAASTLNQILLDASEQTKFVLGDTIDLDFSGVTWNKQLYSIH